jgi:hypothetical protein
MSKIEIENIDEVALRFMGRKALINEAAERYSPEEIRDYLRENITRLIETVKPMTSEQLAYRMTGKPEGVDWSGDEEHFDTSQIVTHTVSGMAHQWRGMARALGHERPPYPTPPEGAKMTGTRATIMGGGGWSGMQADELVVLLRDYADRFLAYLESLPEDGDYSQTSKHIEFGDLTAKGWMLLAAVHVGMHVSQIERMKAQPDYPK